MSSVDDFGDDNDSSAKGGAVRRLLLSRQMARSGQDSEPEASSTASEPGGVGITTRRTTVKKDDKQRGQSSTQAVMGNQPKKENSVDNPNFPTRTSNETIEQECQEPHLTTTSPQAKPSAESLTQLERIHNPKLPTSRPQDWNSTATQPFSDSNIKSGDKFNTFPNAEQDSLTRPGAVAIQGVLNDSSRSNVANVMDRESSNLPLPAPPPPPPPGNRQEPSMPLLQAVPVPRAEENEPDKVIAAAQLVQGTVLSPQMKRWLIAGLLLVIAVAIFLSVTLSRRSSSSSSAKSIGDATTAPTLSLAPSFSPTGAPTLVQYPFTTTDELRVAVAEYFSQDGSNTSQLAARYGYPINTWNVGMIQDFNRLFSGQSNFNEPIHQWDMSNAKNLRLMFEGATSFNQDISSWNVSSVTNFRGLFYNAIAFNQPLGDWDISSASDLRGMFDTAVQFNQPIGRWNTSSVVDMQTMFKEAVAFNQALDMWDTTNVEQMQYMFYIASAFNQAIGNWTTSSVKNMNFMFYQASDFNQAIGQWDTSAVETMQYMFGIAQSFNQDIGSWNISSAKSLDWMFYFASSFDQPLSSWQVSPNVSAVGMFFDAAKFSQNLCLWGGLVDRNVTEKVFDLAFGGTSCPNRQMPDLSADPPGPLCFDCGSENHMEPFPIWGIVGRGATDDSSEDCVVIQESCIASHEMVGVESYPDGQACGFVTLQSGNLTVEVFDTEIFVDFLVVDLPGSTSSEIFSGTNTNELHHRTIPRGTEFTWSSGVNTPGHLFGWKVCLEAA